MWKIKVWSSSRCCLSFWNLYSNKDAFLNDITLTAGVWASVHSQKSGADPGHWNEWDPIAGLSFGLGEFTKFETNYTAFDSLTDSYPTSHHLELVLQVDDSQMARRLRAESVFRLLAGAQEQGHRGLRSRHLRGELLFHTRHQACCEARQGQTGVPHFINIVADPFYQQFDGSDGGTGLAVFCTEVKASVPLEFIPKDYGFWNALRRGQILPPEQ